jgi:uncharacterized protein (DUF3820 family)
MNLEPKEWVRINRALFDVEMSTMTLRVAIDRVNRRNGIPPDPDPKEVDKRESSLMSDDSKWDGLFSGFEEEATPNPSPPSQGEVEECGKCDISFGKYAGKTVAEVAKLDAQYLRWLSSTDMRDPTGRKVVENIRKFLAGRGA